MLPHNRLYLGSERKDIVWIGSKVVQCVGKRLPR
jgi:hypothetical protein